MYIKLIRNEPRGNALTGRLVIDGRWYCDTLERVGYQIPSLCYHVAVHHVTQVQTPPAYSAECTSLAYSQ